MKIGFIGAGNMAEAIISGMLNNSFSKEDISFQEISEERSTYMVDTYGIRAGDENFFEVINIQNLIKWENMKNNCVGKQSYPHSIHILCINLCK